MRFVEEVSTHRFLGAREGKITVERDENIVVFSVSEIVDEKNRHALNFSMSRSAAIALAEWINQVLR